MRLGHTGLNSTLAIIAKSNGVCSECKVVEDVNHVLFNCKKFDQHRQKWKELDEDKEEQKKWLKNWIKDKAETRSAPSDQGIS